MSRRHRRVRREVVMMHVKHGRIISASEAERYADAAIQRCGLVGEGLPADEDTRRAVVLERLLPNVLAVLAEAGEVGEPPPGQQHYAEDGPELAKIAAVGAAAVSILGFNQAANDRFGKGGWSL